MNEVQAITIHQPWAEAIAAGIKRFETRSWATRWRGLLLIHAGMKWNQELERIFTGQVALEFQMLHAKLPGQLAFGAVIAMCDLVEVWQTEAALARAGLIDRLERGLGDFRPNRFAWQLENVIRLPQPIPCRGKQQLWSPPAAVVDAVMNQMRGVTA